MNQPTPPIYKLVIVLALLIGIPSYGWFSGGTGGLLAMAFVGVFLVGGAIEVAFGGWILGPFMVIKWFILFLLYHFVIFCFDETACDAMMYYISGAVTTMQQKISGLSRSEILGFWVGLIAVGLMSSILKMMTQR